jgi:hypothetical protein
MLLFLFVYRAGSILASWLLIQRVIKENLIELLLYFAHVYEVCLSM